MERCIAEGLVGGEGFAVDASLIEADANRQRSIPGSDWNRQRDPETASRSVREYLATLDDAAWGAASDVTPKFVSPSDPAAQWTGAQRGPAFFAYADNYLVDVQSAIIVDVEASRAIRQAEVGAAKTMIDRTADRFGLRPERLAGDTAYGSAEMLNWLVEERHIAPHVPVIDKSARRDGSFAREDFRYDHGSDTYTCPAGMILATTGTLVNEGTTLLYRGSTLDCGSCQFKARCCPNTPARKIPRSMYEGARDFARSLAGTPAFEQSRRERKRVEMLFAHLKRILRMGRLRLRGPDGARTEFLLAATVQNLRKLAKLVPVPSSQIARRPKPLGDTASRFHSAIGHAASTSISSSKFRVFQQNKQHMRRTNSARIGFGSGSLTDVCSPTGHVTLGPERTFKPKSGKVTWVRFAAPHCLGANKFAAAEFRRGGVRRRTGVRCGQGRDVELHFVRA